MAIDDYIGRWTFDEGTGTDAGDSSANANTGTLTNSPAWVGDRFGRDKALRFTAASSRYVTVPHIAAYNFSGPVTMSAWIRPTSTAVGASHATILGKWNGTHEQFVMRFQSGNIFHVGSWNGGDHYAQYNWGSSDINVWRHVVGLYDGTDWKIYKDAVEVASRADAIGALTGTSGALHLGASNTGSAGRYFDGDIDDIRIYDRALSPTEVSDLFADSPVVRIYTAAEISGGVIDIPSDYNSTNNSWHAIGGSPAATDPGVVGGGGVGGGAWARTDNVALTAGGTASAQIGLGDVWVSNTGSAPTATTEGVLAMGGTTNTSQTGGAGGISGSCIGNSANSGGTGGNGAATTNDGGGGGGGAGGPNGAGANGGTGGTTGVSGGGGGANGGSAGANANTAPGGNNRLGSGGGTFPGGSGSNGGGGGGTNATTTPAGVGSTDAIWTDNSGGANDGQAAGPGGGGGGGVGAGVTNANATGGLGGLYGGGAGGSGEDATAHAAGRNGVLVLIYEPNAGADDSGAGSASGTATAAGVSAADKRSSASASGLATASATSAADKRAAGSAAGSATASAVGVTAIYGTGAAAGSATASATSAADKRSAGSASGSATVEGVGDSEEPVDDEGAGSASGVATAAGVGRSEARAAASSSGTGTASGVGRSDARASASAAGSATASAVGDSAQAGTATGTASGNSTALAAGAADARAVGSASGSATVIGISPVADATGTDGGDGLTPQELALLLRYAQMRQEGNRRPREWERVTRELEKAEEERREEVGEIIAQSQMGVELPQKPVRPPKPITRAKSPEFDFAAQEAHIARLEASIRELQATRERLMEEMAEDEDIAFLLFLAA